MYDEFLSRLYASYRPALHEVALELMLGGRSYARGLDVGCGTGRSSLALRANCTEVIGLDNSWQMLRRATPAAGVHYVFTNGMHWPVTTGSVDVVTFAGSLPYLDQDQTLAEVERVTRPGSRVLVYDYTFATLKILRKLGFRLATGRQPPFAVAGTFGEPTDPPLRLLHSRVTEVVIQVPVRDLPWVLLAEDFCRDLLTNRYGRDRCYERVLDACWAAF